MSGIDSIKRKTKLALDEMHDNQNVNPEKQIAGNPEIQKTTQPENQQKNKPFQLENQNFLEKNETTNQSAVFPFQKQQTQKTPTYKMTFNLTEEMYKAFNALYANRIIQGRKTDKSDLISEAIQWLIKMEHG